MKLKAGSEEFYFNPHLVSQVTLSPDRSSVTVHFVHGTHLTVPLETDADRAASAEFLGNLNDEQSGFIATANHLLNLKAALWIIIPEEGPIQVRSADNRTHLLH